MDQWAGPCTRYVPQTQEGPERSMRGGVRSGLMRVTESRCGLPLVRGLKCLLFRMCVCVSLCARVLEHLVSQQVAADTFHQSR